MGLLENNLCWKCKRHEGPFIHAMWARPLVLPIWQEIIRTIQEQLSVPVPESIISFVSRGTGRVCPTFLNQHLLWPLQALFQLLELSSLSGKAKLDLNVETGLR